MLRDPFYGDIIRGLTQKLDHELFERAAASLLRDTFTGLVPIRGGTDHGMDGAIADGKGTPFPLVSTTDDDAIGNLRKSLSSYLANEGTRRRVVFATPRHLTPARR